MQKGTFSSWYANKEAKDQQEMEQNEKLKKEVRRLSQAARRSGEWSDKVEKSKKGQRVAGLRPDRGDVYKRQDIYFAAGRYLGTEPRETYVFEDVLHAIETADKAGFKTVGLSLIHISPRKN